MSKHVLVLKHFIKNFRPSEGFSQGLLGRLDSYDTQLAVYIHTDIYVLTTAICMREMQLELGRQAEPRAANVRTETLHIQTRRGTT